ncbi:MAG TPA: hypothetical protein PK450_03530 [Paracoccaceae bacterium]|nr:hypothetical protein [Paracoccaceae bacterium]
MTDTTEERTMKILATLIARVSRKKSDVPDAFETRLKSLTSDRPVRRTARAVQAHHPILFRRGASA